MAITDDHPLSPGPGSAEPATDIETFLLAEIAWRESRGDYTAPPKNPPYATASGAYQFIKATWAQAAAATGIGARYEYAYQASPAEQDENALWLLRQYGANSSHAWQASGPYPDAKEIGYILLHLTTPQPGPSPLPTMLTSTISDGSTTWHGTLTKE